MASLASVREVLSNRQFTLLWSGQTVSQFGDGILSVALPLLVLAITNNATDLGLVVAARLVPTVVFLLLGGAVTDRVSRRLAMLTSDASRAVITASMGLLALTGSLNFTELLVGSILFGIFDALFYPASTALLPDLISAEHLTTSNSLSRFSGALAGGLIGPITGGVIASTIGTSWSLIIDAGTFVVSAGCLLIMRRTSRPESSGHSMVVEIKEGLLYCRKTPWIFWTIGVAGLASARLLADSGVVAFALQARLARAQLDGGRRLRGDWPRRSCRRRDHDRYSQTESSHSDHVVGVGNCADSRCPIWSCAVCMAGVIHCLCSGWFVDGWQYPLGVVDAVRSSQGDTGARIVS